MERQFVHLRTHTRLSIGASTLRVKDVPKLCAENAMFACAITDTNMMSGCAEFSDVMPSAKIQPIIGVEISLNHHRADPKILRESSLSKVVLLAQNHTGYLNLCELSRVMYMRGENHHLGPYITFEELAAHADGVICLSGAHTEKFENAKSQYHPIRINGYCYGVIAVCLNCDRLESFEYSVFSSILGE